jgi:hypothetical protein
MSFTIPGSPLTAIVIVHIFYIHETTSPPIHDCDAVGGAFYYLRSECDHLPEAGNNYLVSECDHQPEAGNIYRFSPLRAYLGNVAKLIRRRRMS